MLILFDFDGTLVDTEYKLSEGVAELATKAGFRITAAEVFQNFSGLGSEKKFKKIAKHVGKPEALTSELLAALQTGHRKCKADLHENLSLAALFNDEAEALETLQQRGHVLAICSNATTTAGVRAAVERLDLSRWFEDRVYAQDIPGVKSKPSPAIFTHAMKTLGFPALRTVCIGDSEVDMEAAFRASVPSYQRIAFINPLYEDRLQERIDLMNRAGADAYFSDYKELPGLTPGL